MSQVTPVLNPDRLDEIKSPVMRRIIASGRLPRTVITLETLQSVRRFFRENPDSLFVYCFYDGRLIDENDYRKRMTSRTAQLVAISQDGFPVLWSRWAIDFWFGHVA